MPLGKKNGMWFSTLMVVYILQRQRDNLCIIEKSIKYIQDDQ